MRIAVDATVLALPELRGIGSYLCEVLAAWPEPDDTFLLLAPGPIAADRLAGPAGLEVRVVPEPRGSRFHVWQWWSLPRAARRFAPDLFWSPANVAAPLAGLPQAVTVHDTLLQELVRHDGLAERVFHHLVTPWWLRRFATRIVTVSAFSARRIETVLGCDPAGIRVIRNGASLPGRPFAGRDEARAHVRAKGLVDRPYVLALGAESSWKNTEGALRAFALVGREAEGMDFVVAGVQERARERFASLARELGLAGRLRLPGFVAPADRDALYQGAEVFVYPSLFEGFGLPPLEAMALGTPVVASRAAAIPEVVGEAALLADAADPEALARAILRVLGSPDLGRRLVAAGRDNIGRFRWTEAATAHRDLFTECAHA
ncbi:glycosyl transferase group 1 [Solidesulfovibrio carbinoliphilus subsp. oakridgensis]|uniref:Glycosyl transferase group 1 n=1 Tax=Solidesulfovibrio carbinoliphilus subsp. oakridgensis TaxID=694327 RepID=G7QCI6_9BACT|nr:glycosyltransferase family 1 protein [Solidesulfovibrio carbinoliphilus]EHJ46142.1 glycosyl transferase group 1 [Solidesulfovibrio carbinoliphilus subsp. oakridgensis]